MLKKEDVEDIKDMIGRGDYDFDWMEDNNLHTIAEWYEAEPEPMYTRSEIERMIKHHMKQDSAKFPGANGTHMAVRAAISHLGNAIMIDMYDDDESNAWEGE